MTTMSLLRHSALHSNHPVSVTSSRIGARRLCLNSSVLFGAKDLCFHPVKVRNVNLNRTVSLDGLVVFASGSGNSGHGGNGDGSGGGGDGGKYGDEEGSAGGDYWGFFGLLVNGWRSRVAADPQFAFKVLMEELVGVSACIVGDMATRPNFGLNELDLVFSTLVVGCILNFLLMYLLAPTLSSTVTTLPAFFASCPASHMFEPGAFTILERFGTFVYKGIVFAGVGFAAGLVGTAISNGLISMKKKMDPNFETPNTMNWAAHMGFSSNFGCQAANLKMFKSSVLVRRMLNNVVGGITLVILARLTGSQSVANKDKIAVAEATSVVENDKLLDNSNGKTSSELRQCILTIIPFPGTHFAASELRIEDPLLCLIRTCRHDQTFRFLLHLKYHLFS